MKKRTFRMCEKMILLSVLVLNLGSAIAQNRREVTVTRRAVPYTVIKDRPTIQFFVDQYFIADDPIDSMLVLDISDDGFDEKDILEVYPKRTIIHLSESEAAVDTMSNWKRTGYYELTGSRPKRGGSIEVKEDKLQEIPPMATAFFGGMVNLIQDTYNYEGRKLSLFFEFDDRTGIAKLQIWGFNSKREMQEQPKPNSKFAHDLIFYNRTDTVYVDKPVYDVIYIEQTLSETKIDTVLIKGGGGE